jgi:isoleucyl-tRNA synthetase
MLTQCWATFLQRYMYYAAQVGESYRKLRNTARYLSGNLFDFDPAVDAIPYDQLPSMDKWVLGRLSDCLKEVQEAYETYQVRACVLTAAILVLLCRLSEIHCCSVCYLVVTSECSLRHVVQ